MQRLFPLLLTALVVALPPATALANYAQRLEVTAFIDEMSNKHAFDSGKLERLFSETKKQQAILDAISRPAEGKPWHQYRPIFITESRISQGVEFWNKNAVLLARAEQEYGVAAEIIVAIIGVETRYGRHTGSYRVIDSLATLAFDYPPRASFFRGQLEQFLLMAREEQADPLSFTGSYAGAMGKPQFIASSFRSYAVDFDNDGRRDLWQNNADVIGSVANYFKRHHWRLGEQVVQRAQVQGGRYRELAERGYKPSITVPELLAAGVNPLRPLNPVETVALLEMETPGGHEYWVANHNFYVITRYNHSPLYALAVFQLGEAIKSSRAASKP